MENIFAFADDLGPAKIVHVYDPKYELKAVVAIDNVARGPSIGGIRMAPDVSATEAFRLARAATPKWTLPEKSR
jgi:glutamate dehydrogenase (NAD(P)+)